MDWSPLERVNAAPCDPVLATITPEVDAAFYLARNPDVARAGMAAAEHYWRMGWREGRDPSPWFRTEYYLRANPDVAAAGLNPLWHYLVQGRHEGRQPREPGGTWREELDRPPPTPTPTAQGARRLSRAALRRLLGEAGAATRGLVLSISHDRYTDVPGGTQRLIADEQRQFNAAGRPYLHLSPTLARLGLAPAEAAAEWLGVTLDGAWHGVARPAAIAASLPAGPDRLLAIHALHGWRPETVAALARALRPAHAVFWAHDYGAACPNPRLLRNDIVACGAPPPDSMACRICRHGAARAAHLGRVATLLREVGAHIAAPSALAARTWRRATGLDLPVQVHPHVRLWPLPATAGAAEGPVRLGFVGGAAYHKGWGTFRDLVRQARGLPAYRWFQFASPGALEPMDGLTTVAAAATPADPAGMQRMLAAQRIDLLLALSPWPETFSYVAHEAIAAGADLLALEGSGHIAVLARRLGRGVVLADAAALAAFVLSGDAATYAQRRRAEGRAGALLLPVGSTATLPLAATAA
jgi:hypothetical protein